MGPGGRGAEGERRASGGRTDRRTSGVPTGLRSCGPAAVWRSYGTADVRRPYADALTPRRCRRRGFAGRRRARTGRSAGPGPYGCGVPGTRTRRCAGGVRPPARLMVTGMPEGAWAPVMRLSSASPERTWVVCGTIPAAAIRRVISRRWFGRDERDDAAGLAGAGGAAAAVQVVLVVGRRVDVDDEVEVVDVDAAGGDVGGHQHGDVPGLELGQGPGALRLGLAAVQGRGPDPAVQQVLGQPVDGVLGVQEHDHPPVAGRDLAWPSGACRRRGRAARGAPSW